jgi:aspartate/methionine/tyrosine aminotransferase
MGLDPDDVISFAGGWVNHRAPEALRAEYARVAEDPSLFHELGAYSPTRGLPQLREALLSVDRAMHHTPGLGDEHLIVGQSSTQLTHTLFTALLDPADRVVLFDPSYANYGPQLSVGPEGLELVWLRVFDPHEWSFMADPEPILAELDRVLEQKRPRMILFSTPDNPTSQLVPDDIFFRVVEAAARAECYVAVDLAYRAQCFFEPEPLGLSASPAEHPNLIRIHSNSKWCRGLGRRLGWIEAAPEVVDALEIVQQSTTLCPDTVHQFALANYLERSLADGSLYRTAAETTTRCIAEHLGMPCTEPQGGLYAVVDVGRDGDAFVRDILTRTGVIFVPGSGFGASLARGIRVSFGPLVHDLDRIEEGFRRVGAYLRS